MSLFNSGSGSKEENRNTIIAVVLSTLVVGVGFMIQNAIFPPATTQTTQAAPAASTTTPGVVPGVGTSLVSADPNAKAPVVQTPASPVAAGTPAGAASAVVAAPLAEQRYTVQTDLLEATFTNAGGDLVSLRLKDHKDKSGFVDLIVPGSAGSQGLSLAFGGPDAAPVKDFMSVQWLGGDHKTIEFSRTYYATVAGSAEPVPFTYRKAFTFREGEYMFGLAVTLENSRNEYLPLDQGGYAYTLTMGPQIGPRFDQLPKNADSRKYITEVGGKRKIESPKAGTPLVPKEQPSWAAIAGKYFAFIAVPEAPFATYRFLTGSDPAIKQTNTMALIRPTIKASRQTDTYYFYFGPKTTAQLSKYEYADKNAFGRSGLRLEDAVERSNILGWLEIGLKFLLNLFYSLIPNYGVAIILVTILTKAIMFPLTKKGSMASARMQELQPQIAEIQAKYKGNPQKLNEETAAFYKRENYNPMSGCLPMLIQMPLFLAMYNLFNNHFDLRGAMFIPGWIPDLSLPETVFNFGSFRLPILGWNDLRALPIIYLFSQLLYGKYTQASNPSASGGQNAQAANQMKMMSYGMPIMFFFMLYDVPSGLLLYWIISNVLTIAQQIVINRVIKSHRHAVAAGNSGAGSGGAGSGSGGSATGSSGARARTGSDANRQSVNAKNAGKTTVRSGPRADTRSFSEKTREWLEKKAGDAESRPDAAKGNASSAAKGKASGGSGKKKAR